MPSSNVIPVAILTGTEVQIIGPNAKRKSLTIVGPTASTLYIRPSSLGAVVGGLAITSTAGYLELNTERHGDIVQGPWYGYAVGTLAFGILETML